MTKEELVEKIKKLLKTEDHLGFLFQLKLKDMKTFIARILEPSKQTPEIMIFL